MHDRHLRQHAIEPTDIVDPLHHVDAPHTQPNLGVAAVSAAGDGPAPDVGSAPDVGAFESATGIVTNFELPTFDLQLQLPDLDLDML